MDYFLLIQEIQQEVMHKLLWYNNNSRSLQIQGVPLYMVIKNFSAAKIVNHILEFPILLVHGCNYFN